MSTPNKKNCVKGGVHHFVTKTQACNNTGGAMLAGNPYTSINNITEVYCVQCGLVIKLEEK